MRDPNTSKRKLPSKVRKRSMVHDATVQVLLSSQNLIAELGGHNHAPKSPIPEVQANMIISIWYIETERYYTCTFVSVTSTPLSPMRTHARAESGTPAQATVFSSTQSNSSSPISPGSFPSPLFTSFDGIPLSTALFPPPAPPSKSISAAAPSAIQKLARMKDAIIDVIDVAIIVMWHDESLSIQNKAATRLLHKVPAPNLENPLQALSQFKCYTEDFARQLQPDEYPITQLVRTRKPFTKWKIGMDDPELGRRQYDCSGEAIIDETSGDFLAGIVIAADVTEYTDIIRTQHEESDQQFQLICDTMPQMVSFDICTESSCTKSISSSGLLMPKALMVSGGLFKIRFINSGADLIWA